MLHSATEFLETILPPSGIYAAIRFVPASDGKILRAHEWLNSPAEAAARVLYWSAQGYDTYHACASFRERGTTYKGRTQANVAEVAAFWLDIDCGPGKDYPDPTAALQALAAFCRATGLPKPTLVGSGGGIHAYWPLETPLLPTAWRPAARALSALAAFHDLKIDPARTSDHASILRTPGTYNHKNGGLRPVTLLCLSDIFTNDLILPKLAAPIVAPDVPAGMDLDIGKVYAGENVPSYGDLIAHACPQMAAMRDTRGNIPEPEWYACMTVLARCADGEDMAHAWSNGHPDYDFDDTAEKLAHAKAAPGPATCARFAELNPEGCAGCPNAGKLKSPITLGVSAKLAGPALPQETTSSLPPAPEGYFFSKSTGAVCYIDHDKNTDTDIPRVLYPYPLYVETIRQGESTMNSQMMVRHFVPGEGHQVFPVPMRDANGLSLFGHLGTHNVGVLPAERKRMEDYLLRSYRLCNDQMRREMGYEQFGWKGDGSFIYGNRCYRPNGRVEEVNIGVGAAPRDEALRARAKLMAPVGTLERWREVAQDLTADGLEAHLFGLLCGFASPLFELLDNCEGGTIYSLLGESGHGKSYAAAACTSVWGGNDAMWLKTGDTMASRATSIASLKNLPVVIDDAQKFSAEALVGFACSFTDGRDKLRGTVDGGIRMPESGWKTVLVMTSNASLCDKIGTTQDARRIFEVWTSLPDALKKKYKAEGDAMARQFQANRGTAGDFFLRQLVRPEYRKHVEAWLREVHDKVSAKMSSGPEDRFWVRLVACVITAALMVNKMGILEFSTQRLWDWAVQQTVEQQNGVKRRKEEPVESLSRFLSEHHRNTLIVQAAQGPAAHHGRVAIEHEPQAGLWIRKEMVNGVPVRAYIEQKQIRAWAMKEGLSAHEMRATLELAGVIARSGYLYVLGKGTNFSSGQVKVWEVDMTHPKFTGVVREVKKERVA